MENLIKIILIVVFAFFMAKKYIIPRIIAKKAAKAASPADIQIIAEGAKDIDSSAGILSAPERRPVACFDMRLVDAEICGYDENPKQEGVDAFTQRMKCAANEMLLNASARGSNVRLYALNWKAYILLYVTYTV